MQSSSVDTAAMQKQLHDYRQGGSSHRGGWPHSEDLTLAQRNRIVELAEEIYHPEDKSERAKNARVAIKLFREGGSLIKPGTPYIARVLFHKLKREHPEDLRELLAEP